MNFRQTIFLLLYITPLIALGDDSGFLGEGSSVGSYFSAGIPPAGWGLVINDADVTFSGGNFSSMALQYETNGTVTATIAPGAQIESGDGVWLGYYGSDSSLRIESNATLRGDALVVGYDPIASSNRVSVVGEGAWLDAPEIYIGGSTAGAGGIGNRIEVQNGGTVATTDLNIYAGNQFDLNNGGTLAISTNFNASLAGFNFNSGGTLEVGGELTGMGSVIEDQRTVVMNGSSAAWNKAGSSIYVGKDTSGNTLYIGDGGMVVALDGVIGASDRASSNMAVIDGVGSEWHLKNDLIIGGALGGNNNSMVITNGGAVFNENGFVGRANPPYFLPKPQNSKVVVTGKGSLWRNLGSLVLGSEGSGHSLVIEDGGRVESNNGQVGTGRDTDDNSVVVIGDGSLWKVQKSLQLGRRNSVTVNDKAWIIVGDTSESRLPYIGYQGGFAVGNVTGDASLVLGDQSTFNAGTGYLGVGGGESGTMFLSGMLTKLNLTGRMHVGFEGSNNTLILTNYANIASKDVYLGYESSSSGNRVFINGAGTGNTGWAVDGNLKVGYRGSGNAFVIDESGGGWSDYLHIGGAAYSSNNVMSISGEGTGWYVENRMYMGMGAGASGNQLLIDAAGYLVLQTGYSTIGHARGATGNIVRISGEGSTLIAYGLDVGNYGSGNRLEVLDGGYVSGGNRIHVGRYASSSNNLLRVSGKQSQIKEVADVTIGNEGSDNKMQIEAGALVDGGIGIIGKNADANNNSALVSGKESLWHNTELYLGGHKSGTTWVDGGTGNSLTVEDGGLVLVGDIRTNNIPEIGHHGVISIGSRRGSEMIVANGARVVSDLGYVGLDSGINGSVTVTGVGSVWNNSEALHVGYNGSGNSLAILNGGRVSNSSGYIGYGIGASNNNVVVSGAGSVWDNHIGHFQGLFLDPSGPYIRDGQGYSQGYERGGGNEVPDSGTPYADPFSGYIPRDVSGENLSVGHQGSGNTLLIAEGGEVWNETGFIGYASTANDNSVLVSGIGSLWDNKSNLSIGHDGSGNTLRIEDGARVKSSRGYIGYGESANSNRVVVSGTGSVWNGATPPIFLTPFSAEPSPPLYRSGAITIEGPILIIPSNSIPILRPLSSGMGELHVGHDGSDNSLFVLNGGRVESSASYIGYGASAHGNRAVVSGAGSVWKLSSLMHIVYGGLVGAPLPREDFLSVGYGGSGNSLLIEDGGLVVNRWGSIGETSTAWSNSVSVTGAGSEWRNSDNLYLGGSAAPIQFVDGGLDGWEAGGQGNSLSVADGGLVAVGRHLVNRNYSTVTLDDPGSRIEIAGNYYQDATSTLRFGMNLDASGAPTNALVSVGGTAEFEAGTSVQYHYDGDVGWMDFDTFFTNLLIEADRLIVGGVTHATSLDLDVIKLDGSLVDLLLWENDQDIYGLIGRKYLADSAGFAPGSMMAGVSRGIDDLSLLGNPLAVAQINRLNRMSSAQQKAQLTQRYTQGTPTYRHQQSMLGGQKQVMAQSRAFQSGNRAAKPDGAAGPHKSEQELRGWMRGYGSWANHEGSSSFSGFDQNVYGTIVGLDKAVGNVLLGAAGGYSQSNLTQDNNDSSDAKTGFGVLYSSFGSTDWFGDFNVSYGRSRIGTQSGTALGGSGDFDADLYGVYLGGGKEIKRSDGGLLFTPETALFFGYYDQEGYTDGLMDIDSYTRWNCQSRLGAALAYEFLAGVVVLKPEVRAYWLHEFNADPDQLGYTLGGGRYTFGVQSPDEDVFEMGTGFHVTITERFELSLDIDGQYSERYSALTVGARASIEF